jgi:geranylgeranyl pyrophosphate synthase
MKTMNYNKESFYQMNQKFMDAFNHNWNILMETFFFQQQQFSSGNRLRPRIVLLGYLATKNKLELMPNEYDFISKLSMSIEIIHKSSIILDDLIDNDPARHGKNAFHIDYGLENTIMFAIHMLSTSVDNLNKLLSEVPRPHIMHKKGIDLLVKTMHDMSLGELKELNLNDVDKFNSEKIKEIISLETSPLIANSLLLGYYAGNGEDLNIDKAFDLIGHMCGYIFQVMNDLEPFCQQEKLMLHKGRINMDISQSKKNIAFALLYGLLSKKEKDALSSTKTIQEFNNLLIQYFSLYHLKESFMEEVDLTYANIKEQVTTLSSYGINDDWCTLFLYFTDIIVNECKERLS